MKFLAVVIVSGFALTAWGSGASADPWKDESGKSRWKGEYSREYKEEYHSGGCKVERKWGKHGDYKQKVKCKGGRGPMVGYGPYGDPYGRPYRPY
ncbi:MAG: hypothetical protein M3145_12385 [Pseudomonadota bacterium]|nr:hypothetical protein [Pseudomonadota bacterium]